MITHLPEIPSVFVPNTDFEESATNDIITEFRFPTENSQRSMRERHPSVVSQQPRCRTAGTVSPDEMAEWRNVDLLLNRKRRSFQTQTGSIESTKLPWGEEFATIQSLKRFAAQHPDILRAHIETQLRELDGPLLSSSPGKPRSPKKTNASTHSGAGQARESLLLIKDLAFLLKHRLAPFFDSIIPVVLEAVFSAEKRFLCETATEVLDAIILHCSSRKLALLLLQLNETYSKYEDLRLYNLASVYVEKCVHNWSKPECSSLLHSSQSSSTLLTLLATLLASKSAPGQIAAQKSFKHLRDELGNRNFEVVLRAHIPKHLQNIVKTECGGVPKPSRTRHSSRQKSEGEKQMDTRNPTTVQTGPSILQRMLLQRQNRVLPKQP
ncbi:Mannitol dehydrogenase [Phytophthora megakarya]|uniref:Mannitol dehydrogenase n=1 Tax=Phytophthora megakarya TaxID=4795 RepID=A0A225VU95_9STRA|nr:Mannitol dehydrogenase [Phytophthora megakarya]